METITQNESDEKENDLNERSDFKSEFKMDFSLNTPEERTAQVHKIIANTPPEKLTPTYLEKLADYIIFAIDKEERKQRKILTDNRLYTVNRNETSYEGLAAKLENGEDGIYNMMTHDKNKILHPRSPITAEDVAEIPALKDLVDEIAKVEDQLRGARGKKAYALQKTLIDMRKDQYEIRAAYKKPVYYTNVIKSIAHVDLYEKITIGADGLPYSNGIISFFDPDHVSALLCNYHSIVAETANKPNSDAKWMMYDFAGLLQRSLSGFPLYKDLVEYKMDGMSNAEIQTLLFHNHGIKHSIEYISSLWRNKIPKLIAEFAVKEYLEWYYTFKEKGKWKKCSRCGQIKLAHNLFFSKNKTSKDGYYSICKDCRNKKK